MNKAMLEVWKKRSRLLVRLVAALVACVVVSSCKTLPTIPRSLDDFAPAYKPNNIYRRDNVLPAQIQRVAVLPLTVTTASSSLRAGVETLEPILYAELEKTKRFEVIPVPAEQLRQLTGQRGWRSDEPLPPNLVERIREATGADAILFCQLTSYQAYQPISIGWKFSLVESPKNTPVPPDGMKTHILWSVDEVLDSGDPAIANAARIYFMQHIHSESPSSDAAIMQSSPVKFGQYTLATLLDTLPGRSVQIH